MANCQACGIELNKQKAYCSRACRGLAERKYFTCENCGVEFRAHRGESANRFCTRECAWEFDRKQNKKQCKRCGIEYVVKQGYSDTYCSERCAKQHVCSECGKEFIGRPNQTRCSKACELAYGRRRGKERDKSGHPYLELSCKECGNLFVPEYMNKHREYCSDPCRHRHNRRIDKGVRKARARGTTREAVSPIKVFIRDNWHCYICGKATPKRLRGTIAKRAPELDHIMPLSEGGAHTYQNTACACRECNIAKSNKAIGQQLRLIG